MTTLEKTYTMADKAPPPMAWDEYERRLKGEWQHVLDSAENEAVIQTFLEKHPCMIPGSSSMTMTSGHYPFPDAVISQPPLVGIGERIPDFMWLATSSLHFEPVLIEIETPDKKWFNSSGDPSNNFVQAHNQLAQWKAWFDHPENQMVFYENYQVPLLLRQRKMKPSFVLVYGRRKEYENNNGLNRIRAELATDNEYLMSYDRLTPSSDVQYLFTVKKDSNGYRAIAYPPTYVLCPNLADRYSIVNNKEEAIDDCEWMSAERKEFIKSRFPYWEKWAKQDNRGTMCTGDRE